MRQKVTRRGRGHIPGRGRERVPGAAGQDPAEWVLINEIGWGMPHWLVAAIAGLFVLVKAVGWLYGRTADRRTDTRDEDAPPR